MIKRLTNNAYLAMSQIRVHFVVMYLRLKMSEDAEFVSSDVEESAALAVNALLYP
jgi:hypothetical protein